MVKKFKKSAAKQRKVILVNASSDTDEKMVTEEAEEGGSTNEERPILHIDQSEHSDSDDSDDGLNDSDRELQVALKDGLLKTDHLNYAVETKRPIINKVAEIRAKLAAFEKKDLSWLETLDVTIANDSMAPEAVEDDFEREIIFYKQAQQAVQNAIPRLLGMGVKVFRPEDYYAEMAKTDDHMQKVRKRLLDVQQGKQRQEAIRRLRDEKKFAAKVQTEVLEGRQQEKKKLLEAVKKHRKGMKSQLEDMLNNAKRLQRDEEDDEEMSAKRGGDDRRNSQHGKERGKLKNRLGGGKRMGRTTRDKKFGFGGQKKRSKQNDEKSFNEVVFPGMARSGTSRGGRFRGRGGRGRR